MPAIRKYLIPAALLLFFLAAAFFFLIFFLVRPERVRANLTETIEQMAEGSFTFERFDFTYFPRLTAKFEDVKFSMGVKPHIDLSVHHMDVRLRLFAALFKKVSISHIEILEGRAVLALPDGGLVKNLEMDHLRLKLGSVRARSPMSAVFSADLEGASKSMEGNAAIVVDRLDKWDWHGTSFHGVIRVKDFSLEAFAKKLNAAVPLRVKSGSATGELKFQKAKRDDWLHFKTKAGFKKFVYEFRHENHFSSSPALDAALNVDGAWNHDSQQILLNPSLLATPAGKVGANGQILLETGELRDLRITASHLSMENIPQYFVALKEIIPLNVGFSGESDLEASLEGALDHLTVHANWDLTSSLLTYGRYFSKPKDLGLTMVSDFLLKERKILAGDFSLKFQDATIKGALTDFHLGTGEGQFNLITNKFQLAGWEALLPPFQDYHLGGQMKFLANLKGNLEKPDTAGLMFNWTFENGLLERKNGAGIRNAHVILDYSPMAIELKRADFEMNRAPVHGEFLIYNLATDPIANGKFSAPDFEPSALLNAAEELSGQWLPEAVRKKFDKGRSLIERFFPPGESVRNAAVEIHYKDKQWFFPDLTFEAYQGKVKLKAGADLGRVPKNYWIEPELGHIDVGKFLAAASSKEKWMEGSLSLKGRISSETLTWNDRQNSPTGEGEVSIEGVHFDTFDLMGMVRKIQEFSSVHAPAGGGSSFKSLRARFVLKDNKIVTDKLVLVAPEMSVLGNGEIFFDGAVNYRLDVYLAEELAGQVLSRLLEKVEVLEGKKLGPIPFLLAGHLSDPEIKPDPSRLPLLQDELAKKRTQKILRNLLPEEYFFESRRSS